jgi:hypothetical protein
LPADLTVNARIARRRRLVSGLAAAAVVISHACTSTQTSVAPTPEADARCSVAVTSSASSFTASGGDASLTITTARDCTWSIATEVQWVTFAAQRSGQGEATVPFRVAANPVPSARSAGISVGAENIVLNQAAAACVYTLSSTSASVGAAGVSGAVQVSTLGGCRWTASSSVSWLTITSGQTGEGAGTVAVTVSPNPGTARVGQMNIAGQAYTVTQAAAPPPEPPPAPEPTPAPPSPSPGPAPPTSPSPSPTPPPTPPPSPPAPEPRTVEFSGRINSVSGRCPNVSFRVDGYSVTTDSSTTYRRSECRDLRGNAKVDGEGVMQSNGTVNATRLEVKN